MIAFGTLIASLCLAWYVFILFVQISGVLKILQTPSKPPIPAIASSLPKDQIPGITIIRPVKGLDPWLYECLSCTFHQTYAPSRLEICFCISSRDDAARHVLEKLIADFPDFDARILVEDKDEHEADLGPNPKIRNMSRAYREAKHDVIWIVDCNVWVGKGVARRMVDRLCGFGIGGRRVAGYRFVHQLPIVVATYKKGPRPLPGSLSSESKLERMYKRVEKIGGSRLEEMFMATSHAKIWEIDNVPSFRPEYFHLSSIFIQKPPGIDFFSHNICEDVLIGTMLFEKKFFEGKEGGVRRGNGLLEGDFAIQPVANMAVSDYVKRRMRWQRVRKFTPLMATLVEPGTESLVCSALGAFGITSLPILSGSSGVPQDWKAFVMIWTMGVLIWFAVDWLVYTKLLSCASVEIDINAPDFAMLPSKQLRRPFWEWTATWMCRELLALPIWLISFFGGSTVIWRSKTFRIRPDGVVQELT